jgi:hypothetical protein
VEEAFDAGLVGGGQSARVSGEVCSLQEAGCNSGAERPGDDNRGTWAGVAFTPCAVFRAGKIEKSTGHKRSR